VLDDIEIDKPHILLESGVWRGQNKMVSTVLKQPCHKHLQTIKLPLKVHFHTRIYNND